MKTGMSVASFEYRVEPDGSITGIMTAEGEFSYPQSNSNEVKMVVREAGSGPYVTERTEYDLNQHTAGLIRQCYGGARQLR